MTVATATHPDYFPKVMDFIRQWEGGYVDHPADPGGATNLGITIANSARVGASLKGLPSGDEGRRSGG